MPEAQIIGAALPTGGTTASLPLLQWAWGVGPVHAPSPGPLWHLASICHSYGMCVLSCMQSSILILRH